MVTAPLGRRVPTGPASRAARDGAPGRRPQTAVDARTRSGVDASALPSAGRGPGGLAFGSPGELLALQRAVGNAAIAEALGAERAATGRAADGAIGSGAITRPPSPGSPTVQRGVVDRAATHPVLRQPDERPEVEQLQQRLNEEGVAEPALDPDGKFGRLTAAAVRELQARHGLAVDGVAGLRTWGLLDELERRGITGPTATALDETNPVTQGQHDAIELLLHPNRPAGEAGPAMSDTGRGNAYETEMVAALDSLAAEVLARPVDTPAVDMSHANRVGDRAQEEVEAFFGSSITLSSRAPSGDWHPGSTRMGLADATTRESSEGDILGWMDYFMDNGSYAPAAVGTAHHYDGTRARPDHAEHDRVRDVWLSRGGRAKVRRMVQAWPAEASTGTVFLQLRDPAYQSRVGMWDLFMTLAHEFLHLVTHPNYGNAADAIGGGARDTLIEGMDEHMKNEVWEAVRPRIADDTAFRTLVEGPFAAPVVNVADYASGAAIDTAMKAHHYDSLTEADGIASQVGEANVRAAFFMGHNEAIGLGAGSAGEHSLSGLASWTPGGGGAPDQYVVRPGGETVEDVRRRTGSADIRDSAGMGWLDTSHRFAAGETLRVPGLRWHTGIAQDSRAQVADQHGISQEALERANGLTHAPGTTRVAPGALLMIPVA